MVGFLMPMLSKSQGMTGRCYMHDAARQPEQPPHLTQSWLQTAPHTAALGPSKLRRTQLRLDHPNCAAHGCAWSLEHPNLQPSWGNFKLKYFQKRKQFPFWLGRWPDQART